MKQFHVTRDGLALILDNGRWFAGFRARWKALSDGTFRVCTNYVPILGDERLS